MGKELPGLSAESREKRRSARASAPGGGRQSRATTGQPSSSTPRQARPLSSPGAQAWSKSDRPGDRDGPAECVPVAYAVCLLVAGPGGFPASRAHVPGAGYSGAKSVSYNLPSGKNLSFSISLFLASGLLGVTIYSVPVLSIFSA